MRATHTPCLACSAAQYVDPLSRFFFFFFLEKKKVPEPKLISGPNSSQKYYYLLPRPQETSIEGHVFFPSVSCGQLVIFFCSVFQSLLISILHSALFFFSSSFLHFFDTSSASSAASRASPSVSFSSKSDSPCLCRQVSCAYFLMHLRSFAPGLFFPLQYPLKSVANILRHSSPYSVLHLDLCSSDHQTSILPCFKLSTCIPLFHSAINSHLYRAFLEP